ncbi:MAG: hypothetical protein HYX51_10445 [Chloroflexi bacterium]|nr:hypothetical protein [Chloroflexota bacterium]
MGPTETRRTRAIAALLAAARAADAVEDARYGRARRGDEAPAALAAAITRRERRLTTIRAAQAALEAEAQAAAAATVAADTAERARRAQAGEPKKPGKPPTPPGTPEPKAQRNFTDPDARIMKNADQAFVQAYNGQAAVDGSGHQIIVGCLLTNQAADAPHLPPMLTQVQTTTGQTPDEWSADCGYFSAANVAVLEGAGSLALIPPDRQATAGPVLPLAVAQVLTAAGLVSAPEAEVAATESAVKTAMRARPRTDRDRRA